MPRNRVFSREKNVKPSFQRRRTCEFLPTEKNQINFTNRVAERFSHVEILYLMLFPSTAAFTVMFSKFQRAVGRISASNVVWRKQKKKNTTKWVRDVGGSSVASRSSRRNYPLTYGDINFIVIILEYLRYETKYLQSTPILVCSYANICCWITRVNDNC